MCRKVITTDGYREKSSDTIIECRKVITTDGYREKSSDTIIFMCIIEKVTAIGRVTAIGYRPAIGCNMYNTENCTLPK